MSNGIAISKPTSVIDKGSMFAFFLFSLVGMFGPDPEAPRLPTFEEVVQSCGLEGLRLERSKAKFGGTIEWAGSIIYSEFHLSDDQWRRLKKIDGFEKWRRGPLPEDILRRVVYFTDLPDWKSVEKLNDSNGEFIYLYERNRRRLYFLKKVDSGFLLIYIYIEF